MTIKYMIAIIDNKFYEIGHCFLCKIEDDKVTLENDMVWWTYTIPLEKFKSEFIEMSKKDYDLYMELCEKGEDLLSEAVIKKYLDYRGETYKHTSEVEK